MGGIVGGIPENHSRVIPHHLDGSRQILKQIVGNVSLQLGALSHAGSHHSVHCLLRNSGNGSLLLFIGFGNQAFHMPDLIDNHSRIGRHHQQNNDQHQIEYLLLNTAGHPVPEFFHIFPFFFRRQDRIRSGFSSGLPERRSPGRTRRRTPDPPSGIPDGTEHSPEKSALPDGKAPSFSFPVPGPSVFGCRR